MVRNSSWYLCRTHFKSTYSFECIAFSFFQREIGINEFPRSLPFDTGKRGPATIMRSWIPSHGKVKGYRQLQMTEGAERDQVRTPSTTNAKPTKRSQWTNCSHESTSITQGYEIFIKVSPSDIPDRWELLHQEDKCIPPTQMHFISDWMQ